MTARFPKTYCSQCGGEFGPGDEGFSHCADHIAAAAPDLLAALQLVRMSAGWQVLSRESREVIDAAIARATGV